MSINFTDANATAAAKLLGVYTRGSFDCWQLMGPSQAGRRAEIMTTLMGVKMPKAKSGVTAIQAELYKRMQVKDGTCHANRDGNFRDERRKFFGY